MNILVLEDEQKVAEFLCQSLRNEGHQVFHLASLEELENLNSNVDSFDVAIFDRMLGSRDSLTELPHFKKKFSHCAVLILSAINTPEERALALDAGADDYMGKPYSLLELIARLRALKRRETQGKAEKTFYRVGGLHLDFLSRKVTYENKRLDFSSKEFQLLSLFMKRPGQVFSRYQILDQVWNTQLDIESNVVETTIRNIRRKLEEVGSDAHIESRRNVGYWIEA